MKRFHSALFLASVASMALASGASAQIATPGPNDGDPRLHGAGATAVQEIVQDEIDATTISDPNFAAAYLATGSGLGRQAFRNVTNQLPGQPTWDTVQYAFSESGTSASELTQYNTNVGSYGLKPIQVPKFVLPIALAYNPVYARNTATSTDYRFRVNPAFAAATTQINGVNVGGLRMTRPIVCGIFNGTITNWNDTALTNANGTLSLGDPADTTFSTVGAPIRLVGRMDRSGTTDIFTRAMKAHCDAILTEPINKYDTNAEALPYARVAGAADFSGVRADTPYSLTSTAPLAGPINSIGNRYYDPVTNTTPSVPGGLDPNPAPGANGTGLFLMADGSSRVAAAIAAAPDIGTTRVVNGKVGYIGADFIVNAVSGNPNLHAAALNRPSAAGTWHLPSAAAATANLNPVNPPESNNSGAFANFGTDVRNGITMARANPLSWHNVLSGMPAANAGYPITGASNMLLHTCYKPTNYPSIRKWLELNIGIPDDRFTNATTGLMAQSNIGALPTRWQNAVNQTFILNSTQVSNGQTLGALDLWMEAAAASGKDHCNVSTLPGETQPGM
ncbi:substrate-binding domain-containing protein [Sphingobium sp. AS12]|uniref:substrate-binding domain-containing protein n=1 Tax=Sphingobium sp. AS12 TaxID=2849495 RepID=UPI001C313B50|nr:substrate-binding domain-containing protein [Sphingobium sp. AS12]MBV2150041.1 substrate-binding domain-containing protein [Sphingobium sp. AS12]